MRHKLVFCFHSLAIFMWETLSIPHLTEKFHPMPPSLTHPYLSCWTKKLNTNDNDDDIMIWSIWVIAFPCTKFYIFFLLYFIVLTLHRLHKDIQFEWYNTTSSDELLFIISQFFISFEAKTSSDDYHPSFFSFNNDFPFRGFVFCHQVFTC